LTDRQAALHLVEVLGLGQPRGHEARTFLVADPRDALELRVDEQRPTLAVGHDDGVLDGLFVCGEALVAPLGDLGVEGQQAERVKVLGHRNL